MGLLGHYIDQLTAPARDRLIEAQDWCIAEVLDPRGRRCLIGHAEDWRRLAVRPEAWRSLLAAGAGGGELREGSEPGEAESSLLFVFRCAKPADLAAYRDRIRRWGPGSEARLGARFDRLCSRHGLAKAVRIVKARAGRPAISALLHEASTDRCRSAERAPGSLVG